MRNKQLLLAISLLMCGQNDMFALPNKSYKRVVKKCADCPRFGNGCVTRNGNLPACSKYR